MAIGYTYDVACWADVFEYFLQVVKDAAMVPQDYTMPEGI